MQKFMSLMDIRSTTLFKHFIILLSSIVSVVVVGYYFGTFDQTSHIPFLKKFTDPTLYPNDPYLALRYQHYSFFWLFFEPALRAGVLEVTMFLVHIITTYITFWAIWNLSFTLFKRNTISHLSCISLIVPHVGFGGFPLVEFSLLNRTFVLPYILISFNWFLKERYIRSFFLLGIMYNIHIISVNFALLMMFYTRVVNIGLLTIRKLIPLSASFLVGALPVLLWKFSGSGLEFGPNYEWFDILSRSMLYSLFYFLGTEPYILVGTLSGVSLLILFWILHTKRQYDKRLHDIVLNFVRVGLLILALQFVATYFFPSTIIIQLQIIRVGVFITLFTYIYLSADTLLSYEEGLIGWVEFVLMFAVLAISPFPFITLLVFWGLHYVRHKGLQKVWIATSLLLFLVSLTMLSRMDLWRPQIHIFAEENPWHKTQLWAKKNTPKNALFITPPHLWWLYITDWRTFSERSTVVVLSELLEAAFVPDYIDVWKPRFEDIAPGALQKFEGDVFENRDITKQSYYTNTEDDFVRLGRKYEADYVVVEKPYIYDFKRRYENEGFIVYELPRP